MHWTEPATADDSYAESEKKLRDAANQLLSNAALKPSKYSSTSIVRLIVEILESCFDFAYGFEDRLKLSRLGSHLPLLEARSFSHPSI